MRVTSYIRMNRDWEAKFLLLPVEVIEMISPKILHVSWVHPSVRIWRLLDEHHGREVIKVPIGGDFDEASLRAGCKRVHPVGGVLAVVDRCPIVSDAEPIRVAVLMGEGVI